MRLDLLSKIKNIILEGLNSKEIKKELGDSVTMACFYPSFVLNEIFEKERVQNLTTDELEHLIKLGPLHATRILLIEFTDYLASSKRFKSLNADNQFKYICALKEAKNYNIVKDADIIFGEAITKREDMKNIPESTLNYFLELSILVAATKREYIAEYASRLLTKCVVKSKKAFEIAMRFLLTATSKEETIAIYNRLSVLLTINCDMNDELENEILTSLNIQINSFGEVKREYIKFFDLFLKNSGEAEMLASEQGIKDVDHSTIIYRLTRVKTDE